MEYRDEPRNAANDADINTTTTANNSYQNNSAYNDGSYSRSAANNGAYSYNQAYNGNTYLTTAYNNSAYPYSRAYNESYLSVPDYNYSYTRYPTYNSYSNNPDYNNSYSRTSAYNGYYTRNPTYNNTAYVSNPPSYSNTYRGKSAAYNGSYYTTNSAYNGGSYTRNPTYTDYPYSNSAYNGFVVPVHLEMETPRQITYNQMTPRQNGREYSGYGMNGYLINGSTEMKPLGQTFINSVMVQDSPSRDNTKADLQRTRDDRSMVITAEPSYGTPYFLPSVGLWGRRDEIDWRMKRKDKNECCCCCCCCNPLISLIKKCSSKIHAKSEDTEVIQGREAAEGREGRGYTGGEGVINRWSAVGNELDRIRAGSVVTLRREGREYIDDGVRRWKVEDRSGVGRSFEREHEGKGSDEYRRRNDGIDENNTEGRNGNKSLAGGERESPIGIEGKPAIRERSSPVREERSPICEGRSPVRERRSPIREGNSLVRERGSPVHKTSPVREGRSSVNGEGKKVIRGEEKSSVREEKLLSKSKKRSPEVNGDKNPDTGVSTSSCEDDRRNNDGIDNDVINDDVKVEKHNDEIENNLEKDVKIDKIPK